MIETPPNAQCPTPNALLKELRRLLRAFGYSWQGLRAAWKSEPAFRVEAVCAAVLVPLALWLHVPPAQKLVLTGSVFLVLAVELLNSALEAAVDRISTAPHPLAKKAKDAGSAAVLVALLNAGVCWLVVLWPVVF